MNDQSRGLTTSQELEAAFQRLLHVESSKPAELTSDERQNLARQWLQIWRDLNAALDEAFDPADVPYTSLVPEGTGLPSGVDPDEIDDPQLRNAYKAALDENRRKADYYREQVKLRQFAELFVRQAETAIVALYSEVSQSRHELETLLREIDMDAKTSEMLLNKVTGSRD